MTGREELMDRSGLGLRLADFLCFGKNLDWNVDPVSFLEGILIEEVPMSNRPGLGNLPSDLLPVLVEGLGKSCDAGAAKLLRGLSKSSMVSL